VQDCSGTLGIFNKANMITRRTRGVSNTKNPPKKNLLLNNIRSPSSTFTAKALSPSFVSPRYQKKLDPFKTLEYKTKLADFIARTKFKKHNQTFTDSNSPKKTTVKDTFFTQEASLPTEVPKRPFGPKTVATVIPFKDFGDTAEYLLSRDAIHSLRDYTLCQEIGKGAYASVFSGLHKLSNKKFAVKVYNKSELTTPLRIKSVQREISILKKIDCPYIVKLHESIDTREHVFLVMEHIPGLSLHSYLKTKPNRQFKEPEAKKIFKQLLEALEYCHKRDISHRDIKLENIILDHSNNVKLIDFGFATCFPQHKKIKMFCGTPTYMAPEIVAKKEFKGPPADIWAAGVLLYTLLVGKFPFRSRNDSELNMRILKGRIDFPEKMKDQVKHLLRHMLHPNPDQRPTASQVLNDVWFEHLINH